MNNQRRKALQAVSAQVASIIGQIEDLKSELESLRDDEQEYYDNMPESLQGGEKGEIAQEAISNLDSAIDAMDGLNEVVDYIDNAAQ